MKISWLKKFSSAALSKFLAPPVDFPPRAPPPISAFPAGWCLPAPSPSRSSGNVGRPGSYLPDERTSGISIPSSVLNGKQKHAILNGLMTISLIGLGAYLLCGPRFFRCEGPLIWEDADCLLFKGLADCFEAGLTATTPIDVLASLATCASTFMASNKNALGDFVTLL